MNILITGGAGFIGSKLTRCLIDAGHSVRVIDNFNRQVHDDVAAKKRAMSAMCEVIEADILEAGVWEYALHGIDAIVHLAAETGVGQSMYKIKNYTEVNATATAVMLEALVSKPHQVKHITLASSRAVYGEGKYACVQHGAIFPDGRSRERLSMGMWDPVCPICQTDAINAVATDESSPKKPLSIYAISKGLQEDYISVLGRSLGISTSILRFFNVYGDGQSLSNPYTGILTTFHTRLRHGGWLNVYEDGLESRDFIHVDDVVRATVLSLETRANGIYNIGSGQQLSVLDIARQVSAACGLGIEPIISGSYRAGDIRHCYADPTRARSELNFEAEISFEDGLRRFVKWADQHFAEDNSIEAEEELSANNLLNTIVASPSQAAL